MWVINTDYIPGNDAAVQSVAQLILIKGKGKEIHPSEACLGQQKRMGRI